MAPKENIKQLTKTVSVDSFSGRTVSFGVAKFDYVRVLFYGDNRNIFSWFLFCQFGRLAYQSHFEIVKGVNASMHLLG